MEFALSIALVIGVVLFILGFLIVVWAGFKHHIATGFIALIPLLNFIILPSVWHRAYIGFYLSIIGALITLGAWYGGGEQYMSSQAAKYGVTLPFPSKSQETAQEQDKVSSDSPTTEVASMQEAPQQKNEQSQSQPIEIEAVKNVEKEVFVPSGDLQVLPQQALYTLDFETENVSNMSSLQGEYIRIEQKNDDIIEGQVTKSSQNSLFIGHDANSGSVAFEIKADTIRKIEKLVKHDN